MKIEVYFFIILICIVMLKNEIMKLIYENGKNEYFLMEENFNKNC